MNKKLTVNRLALGNLKARKKQYAIMIIGILLAMVLSSSIIFFVFSSAETSRAKSLSEIGYQDSIIAAENLKTDDYNKLIEKKYAKQLGFAHIIGTAFNEKEEGSGLVCWLEDDAKQISNQSFIEGTYPQNENEIAIEYNRLIKLGLSNAKIGDKIKLNLKVQNGLENMNVPIQKEYTLVGIVSDKQANAMYYTGDASEMNVIPSIFVAQNTSVEAGGKELVVAYTILDEGATSEAEARMKADSDLYYTATNVAVDYIKDEFGTNVEYINVSAFSDNHFNLEQLFTGGTIMVIVMIVMVLAACVAIINAFNSNLKDRRQQIGMMRAVGTTKRQIINIYGREAFIISLLVTPVSIAISYFLVKLALGIISDNAVMSKSLVALPVAAVVNILVVMLAAFVPLKSASKITPMQAIRNTANNRKAKLKKIKSLKKFNTSRLWAKRSLTFYKGSHITVSIIMCVVIIFTCFSTSLMSYANNNIRNLPYDYVLSDYESTNNVYYNATDSNCGFTQADFYEISAKPYTLDIVGSKSIGVNILVDDYTEMQYALMSDNVVYYKDEINSVEEYNEAFTEGIKNKVLFSDDYHNYNAFCEEFKKKAGINKEIFATNLNAVDDTVLSLFENNLVDGEINYEKIASGEEVILVAPQKYEQRMSFGKAGSSMVRYMIDDECDGKTLNADTVVYAENTYKAGDTIELAVATANEKIIQDEESDMVEYQINNLVKRNVKIGAVISSSTAINSGAFPFSENYMLVTDMQGLNAFAKNINYTSISIRSAEELNTVKNLEIMEDLTKYTNTERCWLESNYEYVTRQKEEATQIIAVTVCVTVLGFAICASIINNSISAKIRESKRAIGMLRTVGADTGTLVKSFVNQMLSMFIWGISIGYAVFTAGFFAVKFASNLFSDISFEMYFNPWFALAMTILSFIICSINVYSKIKKEMKNSIVENIREL